MAAAAQPAPVFSRRVLLAVAGLSPQVITETVYALAQRGTTELPTEIRVLTTAAGADRVRLTLLSQRPGWFARLRRDCALPAIAFDESCIHLVRDHRGRPLPDIRTPGENDHLADQVTSLIRDLTADPKLQLHVSLAGGRKTMGFYAGYALSLYGRPQDRLSHVLVTPPFESHPNFFYPAPRARIIYGPGHQPLDASRAQVTLAEIPFVRLREGMSRELIRGRAGFSATVAALNRASGPPRLRLEPRPCRIRAGGAELRLPPREMAFYLWLARRAVAGLPAVPCPPAGAPEAGMAREYLAELRRVQPGLDPETSPTCARLRAGMTADFFTEVKSRLHAALLRAGVPAPYHVQRVTYPDRPSGFRLGLEPDAIEIVSSKDNA